MLKKIFKYEDYVKKKNFVFFIFIFDQACFSCTIGVGKNYGTPGNFKQIYFNMVF